MEIRGLTTASSIFMAAAVGTAAGCALYTLAALGSALALVVLGRCGRWSGCSNAAPAASRAQRASRTY